MSKRISPCQDCGGPKGAGRGRKLCGECLDRRRPVLAQAMNARKSAKVSAARAARRLAEGRPPRRYAKDAPAGQKWCARCEKHWPLAQFPTNGKSRSSYCRPCQSEYLHARGLARGFDMTPEQYALLLESQDGRCAICLKRPRKQRLAVDHDHDTGAIRGLLCVRCNHRVLGGAGEKADVLRRAADYLEDPPAPYLPLGVDPAEFEAEVRAMGLSSVSVRHHATISDLGAWMDEAEKEAKAAGVSRWAVVFPRRSHATAKAFAVIPAWLLAELMREDVPA